MAPCASGKSTLNIADEEWISILKYAYKIAHQVRLTLRSRDWGWDWLPDWDTRRAALILQSSNQRVLVLDWFSDWVNKCEIMTAGFPTGVTRQPCIYEYIKWSHIWLSGWDSRYHYCCLIWNLPFLVLLPPSQQHNETYTTQGDCNMHQPILRDQTIQTVPNGGWEVSLMNTTVYRHVAVV